MRIEMLNRIMLFGAFVGVAALSSAENISGTVMDTSQKPVEFANIVLLNPQDSTYITGGISNIDGHFSLEVSQAGLLRVSCLGFDEVYVPGASGNVGNIVLSQSGVKLDEVVVSASRPMTKIKDDALVTTVENSPLAHAGTAKDVLGRVPGVIKNGESIEVLGKGAPLVYINGRLMRNASELDQLSSASIKDVEVITSPGAQYDASVNSVIRIKTVKPVGEGFGFDSRTVLGVAHYIYGLEELNFNYRKDGFDLFGMVEYDNNRDRQSNTMVQDTYAGSLIHQSTDAKRYNQSSLYAGKLGMNYIFNDSHSLGFIYDFSFRPTTTRNDSYTSLSVDRILENELTTVDTTDFYSRQHLVSGYYNGRWGEWQLDVNADAMWSNQDKDQQVNEMATTADNRIFSTANNVDSRLFAAKAVVSRPVWKGRLSFGTEWSFIRRTDLYTSRESFIDDSDTKIQEDNGAGFVELVQTFGKVTAMAGLRYEHADSRYYDHGKKMDEQSRTYDNLFPSVMVSFPVQNVRMKLNYTRKISRPAFSQLNGNVQYINRYTYQSGNPYLKPSFRDYLSFLANYRWLTVMVDYAHVSDYIMSVYTQYGDDPEIALLQKQNVKPYHELTGMVNVAPTFGIYHPVLMAGVRAQFFDVQFRGQTLRLDKPMGIFRFNNALHLPFDSWLNVDFSWRTAGNAENMYLEDTWQCDLGLYKSFNNDRWSVKLQCNDLFSTANSAMVLRSDIREITMNKVLDTRNFSITVRYKFNATKSKYKGTGAGKDQKSRL